MKYVTRFNPTTNGALHLGHVYIMLFNERLAHDSGGAFYVRFEDNQVDTLYTVDYIKSGFYCQMLREAIEWLEIPVDEWVKQSDMDLQFKQFIADHGWHIPEYHWPFNIPIDPSRGDYSLEEGEWYPYVPFITYHKVAYDAIMGVNVLVRGDDLRSEFSLYQHYRVRFGLPIIDHYYMPRLYGPKQEIIKKFYGSKSVLDYKKEGWRPQDLIDYLAESALKDPADGWKLTNVKQYPRLLEDIGQKAGSNHNTGISSIDDYLWHVEP